MHGREREPSKRERERAQTVAMEPWRGLRPEKEEMKHGKRKGILWTQGVRDREALCYVCVMRDRGLRPGCTSSRVTPPYACVRRARPWATQQLASYYMHGPNPAPWREGGRGVAYAGPLSPPCPAALIPPTLCPLQKPP